MVSVSRIALEEPHLGHEQRTQSLASESGDPPLPDIFIPRGNSTGNWDSGTGTIYIKIIKNHILSLFYLPRSFRNVSWGWVCPNSAVSILANL